MRRRCCRKTTWVKWLMLPALLVGVGGCGKATKVTGRVSYKDRAVTHGSVIFLSDTKIARSGVINPDGSYTVEGVPPGRARIGVISRDPLKGRSVLSGKKGDKSNKSVPASGSSAAAGWFPLPRKFESPVTSQLTCTIDSRYVSHDIDLME
jgi:hypothetical protein